MQHLSTPLELAAYRQHYAHADYGAGKIVLQLIDELARVQGWNLKDFEEEATELNRKRHEEQRAKHNARLDKIREQQLAKSRKNYFKKHGCYPEDK